MEVHKRYLTGAEIEHIRETLRACSSEFDELFRTKEWFCTSVTDQIESSLEILAVSHVRSVMEDVNKEVKNDKEESDSAQSVGLGLGDLEPERQRGVHHSRVRSGRYKAK